MCHSYQMETMAHDTFGTNTCFSVILNHVQFLLIHAVFCYILPPVPHPKEGIKLSVIFPIDFFDSPKTIANGE